MPARLRLVFGTLTGVMFLIPSLALYRDLAQRRDIWWTPPGMALSLAESQDRVQILVRGRPLHSLVSAGQLRIAEEAGAIALAPEDLKFRFNNWDRVRASRLPMLLIYAAAMGASLVLLILIVAGRGEYRAERSLAA